MSSVITSLTQSRAPVKFDGTLGALMVGGLIGTAFWGITSVQAYNYFIHTKNQDRPPLKLMVGFLWFLDTVDSVLSGHTLYHYLVTNYGNIFALLHPSWSIIARVALTSVTNFTIRTLFAHRVYRLSNGNRWMAGWIMLISTAQLVVGLTFVVITHAKDFGQISRMQTLFYCLFIFSTISDLSVTSILSWLLYKSRTGYTKTDTVIRVLMAYTVNTGLVVAITITTAMIMYITMPHNFLFIAFYLIISKLYLNSYLATLNARETLRTKAESSFQMSGLSSGRRDMEADTPGPQSDFKPIHISAHSISIHTLTEQKVDSPTTTRSPQGGYYGNAF